MNQDFHPTNSKTLVVIGAGATAALGMPTTAKQTELFRKLAKSKKGNNTKQIIKDYFDEPDLSKVITFLELLDSDNLFVVNDTDINNAKFLYGRTVDEELLTKRIFELRQEYDWNAVKKIIPICAEQKDEKNDNLILDLYSIIDQKLLTGQSLSVQPDKDGNEIVLSPARLQAARNFLILFVNMMFASAWYKITKEEDEEVNTAFSKYKGFINSFDCLMKKEGLNCNLVENPPENRGFYLFSTSFVSFNFDMVFPWIFMNSHYEMNHQSVYIQDHPLKLWLDYGVEHRGRKMKNNSVIPTLEFTESVASRQNEEDHVGTPYNRAGKFYFAHGSSNWRECPICGRMTFYFGYDENRWKYKSKQLIPPMPFPIFEIIPDSALTKREIQWRNQLHFDSLQCMHCGAETRATDAPMIMQTMHKSTPTSFLEEIQRNVKVSIGKAEHIVLLGYSLPTDDTIWQQAFAEGVRSRVNGSKRVYCSVVVCEKDNQQHWMKGKKLEDYINSHENKKDSAEWGIPTIENAIAIFGMENVRVWAGGIPQVFGNCTERDVKELFYPDFKDFEL